MATKKDLILNTLRINGGLNHNKKESQFADLDVKGGAFIKQKLCVGSCDIKQDLRLNSISEYVTGSGINVNGVVFKDGVVYAKRCVTDDLPQAATLPTPQTPIEQSFKESPETKLQTLQELHELQKLQNQLQEQLQEQLQDLKNAQNTTNNELTSRAANNVFYRGQVNIAHPSKTCVVFTPAVTAESLIFLSLVNPTPFGPVISVTKIEVGNSFTIASDIQAGAYSEGITVNWFIHRD